MCPEQARLGRPVTQRYAWRAPGTPPRWQLSADFPLPFRLGCFVQLKGYFGLGAARVQGTCVEHVWNQTLTYALSDMQGRDQKWEKTAKQMKEYKQPAFSVEVDGLFWGGGEGASEVSVKFSVV